MTTLTIEHFAAARARLDGGIDAPRVYADLGLDEAGWRREQEQLLAALASDADTGELGRIQAYQRAYDQAWRTLRGEPITAAQSPAPPPPLPSPPAAPTPAVAAPASMVQQASFQRQPAMPPPQAAPPPVVHQPPIVHQPPFVPPQPPPIARPLQVLDMNDRRTVPASSTDIQRLATPFQPSAPGAATPPPSKPVAPRIDTGTAPAGRSELEKVMQAIRAKEQAANAPASGPAHARTEFYPHGPPSAPVPSGATPPTVVLPDTPTNIPGLMGLADYARITATLTSEGDPPATFKRLGIDAVAWMTTVRAYSAKFAETPALEATFRKMVDEATPKRR